MSAKQQILTYLLSGKPLSVNEARNKFYVENVSARVYELRQEGYPIYTNVATFWDGSKEFQYRLGKPSRSMRASARARGIKLKKV